MSIEVEDRTTIDVRALRDIVEEFLALKDESDEILERTAGTGPSTSDIRSLTRIDARLTELLEEISVLRASEGKPDGLS